MTAHKASHRVIYISYNLDDALKLHALDPKAMLSVTIASLDDLRLYQQSGIVPDRLSAFIPVLPVEPALISALDRLGIERNMPTFLGEDTLDQRHARGDAVGGYLRLMGEGVDLIATDRPIEAAKELGNIYASEQARQCGIIAAQ